MTLKPQQLRALLAIGAVLILVLAYQLWPESSTAAVPPASDSVELQQRRLARLRELAATVPGKEQNLKKASAELALREKGLIRADSAAQAQAQLSSLLRQLAAAETPPIEIRSTELTGIAPLSDAYGSVAAAIQFECHIEQLLNFMAALAGRTELISTRDLRITSANQKDKTISVRLTAVAVVPRSLLPNTGKSSPTKGGAPF